MHLFLIIFTYWHVTEWSHRYAPNESLFEFTKFPEVNRVTSQPEPLALAKIPRKPGGREGTPVSFSLQPKLRGEEGGRNLVNTKATIMIVLSQNWSKSIVVQICSSKQLIVSQNKSLQRKIFGLRVLPGREAQGSSRHSCTRSHPPHAKGEPQKGAMTSSKATHS